MGSGCDRLQLVATERAWLLMKAATSHFLFLFPLGVLCGKNAWLDVVYVASGSQLNGAGKPAIH